MLEMGNIALTEDSFMFTSLVNTGACTIYEKGGMQQWLEYFGGTKEDYEAINANNTGNEFLCCL